MANALLDGVRVLDLTRLLPGPFCTLWLAQLGAEVIKIEEPNGGDYARALSPELFALVNRGKKSVTLDLRRAEDRDTFLGLVETADVVVDSFRPGVMEKLGCGYAVLKQRNPRIVHAAITGYGQDGPLVKLGGHDINYCALSGVLDQVGTTSGELALSNLPMGDIAGGSLAAGVGILAGVLGARQSGEGTFVDVSITDGMLAMNVIALATLRSLGQTRPRGTDGLSGGLPIYGTYACADGKHFALGAVEYKFFANFARAVGREELLKLPLAPGEAGRPLRDAIAALFREKTRDEWATLLAVQDCCATPVLTLEEALASGHARTRGFITETGGKPAVDMPLRFSRPLPSAVPAPGLGADNAAVLPSTTACAAGA